MLRKLRHTHGLCRLFLPLKSATKIYVIEVCICLKFIQKKSKKNPNKPQRNNNQTPEKSQIAKTCTKQS